MANKGTKNTQGEKIVSSISGTGKTGCQHAKKWNRIPILHHSQQLAWNVLRNPMLQHIQQLTQIGLKI